MSKLILASASPRRRQLMADAGYTFEVIESPYQEDMTLELPPAELARVLALNKARAVDADGVIIGADTIVVCDGHIMGKPVDADDARRMLRMLGGVTHEVMTGIAVVGGDKEHSQTIATKVSFRVLTEAEIEAYISTGEPMDKAGAYAIQGGAAVFVESIDGAIDNVIGLPMRELGEVLGTVGVVRLFKHAANNSACRKL